MQCKKPMRRWLLGYKESKQKKDEIVEIGKVTPLTCLSPYTEDWDPHLKIWKRDRTSEITNQIISCGQCAACRLEKSRQWAVRCTLEAQKYENNWFVTLTYDEEHVPLTIGQNDQIRMTLKINDLSGFIKRLRERNRNKGKTEIRFFGAGEYGDQYERPHYHVILFNTEISDLRYVGKSQTGYKTWHSKEIENCWGKGRITINEYSFEAAAYTARYIMKKQNGQNKKIYEWMGIEPEAVRMSRRPGIAFDYYDQRKKTIYEKDEMFVATSEKIVKLHSLKYFDRLFDAEDHLKMKEIKEKRREAAEAEEYLKNARTTKTPEERRKVANEILERKLRKLPRSLQEL